MPEWDFLIFQFFCYFFRNFLPQAMNGNRCKNFFSLFLGLSTPVLAKNNSIKRFFNFLIFFLFFSKFSCPGRVWTEFVTKIFFLSFSVYLIPFWLKLMPKRGFLIFLIFFLFFSEFSYSVRVWTIFGTKFFFSLSRPISSCLG